MSRRINMPLNELTPPHLRVNLRNKEEQKLFEKWAMSQGTYALSKEIDGSYINGKTRSAFRAWVARSKIDMETQAMIEFNDI